MKIGVKTFDNPAYLKKFEDKVDFFEIMAIETNNYDFIKELKLPIVIHSQHRLFGINAADKEKEEINSRSIDFAIKIADIAGAKKIILHPGDLDTPTSTYEQAVNFVKNLKDKRIIIENIPKEQEIVRLCMTPQETKKFLQATGKGLCFDIGHAIWAAINFNEDYKKFIKEFLKLKPVHYHIGGLKIHSPNLPLEQRDHLPLRESDFDLKEILKLIPKDAEITLETTTDPQKTLDDVNTMKKWMKELGEN